MYDAIVDMVIIKKTVTHCCSLDPTSV